MVGQSEIELRDTVITKESPEQAEKRRRLFEERVLSLKAMNNEVAVPRFEYRLNARSEATNQVLLEEIRIRLGQVHAEHQREWRFWRSIAIGQFAAVLLAMGFELFRYLV